LSDRSSFDPRAQRGEIGGERCAEARGEHLDVAVEARNSGVAPWRQPYDAPFDVRTFWRGRPRQQPLDQMRPGLKQTVAHEQHNVGAYARFAGGREHDSGFAQTVEIPQQSRRMHMLDDAADPFSERNGRSCPVNIRAEPGDERLTASRQKSSRGRGRVVHRRERAVDRRCNLRAD